MLTHGGLPEEQALHWNEETRQQIGQIVFMLVAGDAKKAQQAYIKFYELKRQFFAYEFDQYIDDLDEFRIKRKFKTLTAMIKDAGEQMVTSGRVVDVEPQPPDLPEYVPTSEPPVVIHREFTETSQAIHSESVEQMCLF
jgi:hypothetical protein